MAAGLYTAVPDGAKDGPAGFVHHVRLLMSRSLIIVILLLVVLVGGAFLLAGMNTEVAPKRVEKAMLDETVAK